MGGGRRSGGGLGKIGMRLSGRGGGREAFDAFPVAVQRDLLLSALKPRQSEKEDKGDQEDALEVPPVLLVDQDQVEVVPRRELLVDVAEGRSELEAAEEQSNRDRLACQVETSPSVICENGMNGFGTHLARERRP